ncbi:uncharacterized protein LOC109861748 [Pseudomyrmex gracilis]|uniref:uncharacterized protein LOC109861748 n=1 Tax=Pseudomyrmex gracilis TaxID=219809 RepID=UPI00099585B4|nr:uncharacterized protein LOC109861748 [Pseudomyrmex gracilis]
MALYGSPLWAEAAAGAGARSKFNLLRAAQKKMALRVARGFRDEATETAGVLAGISPLALLARDYSARYSLRVELLKEDMEGDALGEAIAESKRQARQQLLQRWKESLSVPRAEAQKVIRVVQPHLQVWLEKEVKRLTYRVTQVLTGHGCFGEYLCQIGKEPTTQCHECKAANDSTGHTVEKCPKWSGERQELAAEIGQDLSQEGLMKALASRDEEE